MLDESLSHNGVKGMHWGVVRDKGSNGRVDSSQKFVAKAKEYDSQIKTLRRGGAENKSLATSEKIHQLNKLKTNALKDAENMSQGKLLTTSQKRVVVGATIVGAVVLAGMAETKLGQSKLNPLRNSSDGVILGAKIAAAIAAGSAFRKLDSGSLRSNSKFKMNPSLAGKMSSNDVFTKVVKGVNPGYGAPGTKMNCRRATFAFEMRRRGYDVRATRTLAGTGQGAPGLVRATDGSGVRRSGGDVFKEAATMNGNSSSRNKIPSQMVSGREVTSAASIYNTLKKEPVGSRGEVGLKWLSGKSGHSVAYEVFKDGPVVFDNQSGEKYSSPTEFKDKMGNFVSGAGYTRLDNVPLNTDYLNRWVANVDE